VNPEANRAAAGGVAGSIRPLLDVRGLRVEFPTATHVVRAVNGVSFALYPGETIGLVGESGCGKSTTALAIVGLVPRPGRITAGSVLFKGSDLVALDERRMRQVRGGSIAMIFQDPMTALNPVMTIGAQIGEALYAHRGLRGAAAKRRAVELLELVGIPSARARLRSYPHQLSGGMRQRAMIASAISCEPQVLIADEPTTALDVTIQAQILEVMQSLKATLGMSIVLVSHNLGVVAGLADRIQVMYAGYIVEEGRSEGVLLGARHPYTAGLLQSLARIDEPRPRRLRAIPGTTPTMTALPAGCPFRPRCGHSIPDCATTNPPLRAVATGHRIACLVDITGGGGATQVP